MKNDPAYVQWAIDRVTKLASDRAVWDTLWQDIGNFVMPRKAEIKSTQTSPDTSKQDRLFDGTAIRANMILANGQLAWMTPMESRWFAFDPPHELKGNDKVEQWFRAVTERIHLELARSNFYTEIHEGYLDRGAFGTSTLTCEEGKRALLNFRALTCGSYSIAEDSEGFVDTLCREVKLTLRAARDMFGEENLPEKLRKQLTEAKQLDTIHTFLHLVFPRTDRDPGKMDPENKPIASLYLHPGEKKICRVSGYDEQNFFTTRFLKWGDHAYGWSPAWVALPESRQLNFLEKQMDALAETAAFPRLLIPTGYKGTINLKANGITYYDTNGSEPKEWLTTGRYDVGKDRAEIKRKAIEDAYHVDLFKMFAQLDKQMTAREVAERSAEKLIQFSPTFSRMTTEFFNPLLIRCFAIGLRAGVFPQPPRELVLTDSSGAFIPDPEVSYSSRIALAIKNLENSSFFRTMEGIMPLAQIRPEILDNFDLDEIVRDLGRNEGLPSRWITDEDVVAEMRNARAQQVEQAQQMAALEQGASALQKAGAVPADSPAAQMLTEAAA